MKLWHPSGLVSPLPLPASCGTNNIVAVWMPVGEFTPSDPLPNLSNVPLVDAFEASTFVTAKRALEHASARYALATLLRDIGFDHMGIKHSPLDDAEPIDMRITNVSEYRAWRTAANGLSRDHHGAFGVINLLGPREASWTHHWNDALTFVELRVEFLSRTSPSTTGSAHRPLKLRRTYISVFDVDAGLPRTGAGAGGADAGAGSRPQRARGW